MNDLYATHKHDMEIVRMMKGSPTVEQKVDEPV